MNLVFRAAVRVASAGLLVSLTAFGPAAAQSGPERPAGCSQSPELAQARARFEQQSMRGSWDEAIADATAEAARHGAPAVLRAAFALHHAEAAHQRSSYSQADPAGVLKLLDDADRAVAEAGDECLAADAHFLRAEVHYWQAFEKAVTWDAVRKEFDAVVARVERTRDPRRLARALFFRGLVDQQQEVSDHGEKFFERAKAIAIRERDDYRLSYLERHLAGIADTRGNLAAAEAGFRRSLALREQTGATFYVPPAQIALADVLQKKNPADPEVMRLYLAAADGAAAAKGNRVAAAAHGSISSLLAARGDKPGAIRHAESALKFAQAYGAPRMIEQARKSLEELRTKK